MPYSTGCTTPLSNFEAGLNYKEVPDPASMFPLLLEIQQAHAYKHKIHAYTHAHIHTPAQKKN